MSALKDLTGQKFGRLTVIERAENTKDGRACWRCRCECGNTCIIYGKYLRKGFTKSCGCLHKEKFHHQTHKMSGTRIYQTWAGMIQRCTNVNDPENHNYGERNIKVCERWLKFENFYEDVSKLPHCGEEGYSLDRIDNNGNYEPHNVRFATAKEQVRNRRNTILVEYKGVKIPLIEAAEKSGINYRALISRYQRGDRGDKLFRPVR